MARVQGSFILMRDSKNNESKRISHVRVRPMSSPNPMRPKITELSKRKRHSIDDVRLLKSYSSNDENGSTVQQFQTTASTIRSDDLYDSDLNSDNEDARQNHHTAKGLYFYNCKNQGVPSSSAFINILDSASSCVEMRYAAMKPVDIKVMIPSLKISTTITKLDLAGNGFGSIGTTYLAKLIKDSEYIVELDLSYNDIGLTGRTFHFQITSS
ncbi:unnamed protein product [Rotaria sp. Silwood2]|nr:unnamed protein product [Rotaria sp. Silwood2]CAF3404252.1 unnamed protein product [Rotaria sp. Silwood2]CAF4383096.1 unnamed protein product [Rotaria sp. Silwood2]CAF4442334.1 unnamed protein product [Rotaria sp. Silwood2]